MMRPRRLMAHPLASFALRRLLSLVVILIGLVVATFLMIRLIPGDPALNVAGLGATGEDIARVREQLLLDRPILEQFQIYVTRMAQGDLGRSFFTRQPVSDLITQRIGTSLQLAAAALAIVMLVSVPLGILMGAFTR